MYSSNAEEQIIRQLTEELPDLVTEDVLSLIALLKRIQDNKFENLYSKKETSLSITNWVPHRILVKEVINLGVAPCFISKVVKDFRQYALAKGLTLHDNLDSKFMRHINFMIESGRITLTPKENNLAF